MSCGNFSRSGFGLYQYFLNVNLSGIVCKCKRLKYFSKELLIIILKAIIVLTISHLIFWLDFSSYISKMIFKHKLKFMKKIFKIFLLAILVSSGIINSNEVKAQTANVSFSIFYNSLKPYGHWVNHPKYGQVWVSNTRGFTPYSTGGHWAYTDYGWTWVSDYDWGWAPFHYGRWAYESSLWLVLGTWL